MPPALKRVLAFSPIGRRRPVSTVELHRTLGEQMGDRIAVKVGVVGWAVIIAAAIAVEITSLVDPHVHTLSHLVRDALRPVWGRSLLLCVWLLLGFAWFVPRDRRPYRPRR